jgi:predicted phosphoribosyltransferase
VTAFPFRDRKAAGRALATALQPHLSPADQSIVLALPRGGVPVAAEVAAAFDAELDVFVVRKLGVPGREELAMGAIASGGTVVINERVVTGMDIPEAAVGAAVDLERRELDRRERAYRDDRPPARLAGRNVVLVDDGLATGATMRAAITAVRTRHPARLLVAVPVASRSTIDELRGEVDDIVVVATPSPFYAVGQGYRDFSQTTDAEVRNLLDAARTLPRT